MQWSHGHDQHLNFFLSLSKWLQIKYENNLIDLID